MTFQPVPAATIVAMCVTLLICFGVPIALFILCRVKLKAKILPFFVGCVSFVLFALVLEPILHQLVLGGAIGAKLTQNIWLYAIYGGLAAGLFEETGRYVFLSLLMRKDKAPQNALMYGAGHGGIEAILIVGVAYINNLVYSFMINAGQAEQLLAPLDAATRAATEQVLAQFSTYSPAIFLAAGLERLLAIALHIALSVIIYTAIRRRQFKFALLAFALHMLVDSVTIIIASFASIAVVELAVLVMVALISVYAARLYKQAQLDTLSAVVPEEPSELPPSDSEQSAD